MTGDSTDQSADGPTAYLHHHFGVEAWAAFRTKEDGEVHGG
jgi:hypothetical protein